ELLPTLRPELSVLVGRMLAKQPAERPTMSEIEVELDRLYSTRNRESHPSLLKMSQPPVAAAVPVPMPEMEAHPSTLRQATGQRSSGGSRSRMILAGVAISATLLASGGLTWQILRSSTKATRPSAANTEAAIHQSMVASTATEKAQPAISPASGS